MHRVLLPLLVVFALAVLPACDSADPDPSLVNSAANDAAARAAKTAFLAGINSNDLAQFMTNVTDDVVFLAPNSPAIVGADALEEWVAGYLEAYQTRWEKDTDEFVVRGDLAYERYSYRSVDTPRAGGPAAGTPVVTDAGNGLVIYRRGADGVWKVARDSWASAGS
jgi:ketosteroid isomerase-like protein